MTGTAGEAVVASLQDIAPDLGEWLVSFAYGDVVSRPGLDKRSRQFATVAALTAMGHAPVQLKSHIHYALNVGCTAAEIVEVILQMGVYAGFPCTLNAIAIAREVFRERGVSAVGAGTDRKTGG
ncbi:MAG: carboxymuconolactone decarboxylase family protein [Nevskia sp.]|nr:carboxymuconolactone decarboxylase family protein [Nevskia sp.]